jgi:hypothetical protein
MTVDQFGLLAVLKKSRTREDTQRFLIPAFYSTGRNTIAHALCNVSAVGDENRILAFFNIYVSALSARRISLTLFQQPWDCSIWRAAIRACGRDRSNNPEGRAA